MHHVIAACFLGSTLFRARRKPRRRPKCLIRNTERDAQRRVTVGSLRCAERISHSSSVSRDRLDSPDTEAVRLNGQRLGPRMLMPP